MSILHHGFWAGLQLESLGYTLLPFVLWAGAVLIRPASAGRRIGSGREGRRRWVLPLISGAALLLGISLVERPLVLVAGCITAWGGYRALLGNRSRTRMKNIQLAQAAAFEVLATELASGQRTEQALAHAAEAAGSTGDREVTTMLERAHVAVKQGTDPAEILKSAAPRLGDLHYLGVLLELGQRTGIPLAGLVDHARRSVTQKMSHQAATTADVQGSQISATMLAGLPVMGILLGEAMGAQPLKFLFGTTAGNLMLTLGLGLVVTGYLWCHKILNQAMNPTN